MVVSKQEGTAVEFTGNATDQHNDKMCMSTNFVKGSLLSFESFSWGHGG